VLDIVENGQINDDDDYWKLSLHCRRKASAACVCVCVMLLNAVGLNSVMDMEPGGCTLYIVSGKKSQFSLHNFHKC